MMLIILVQYFLICATLFLSSTIHAFSARIPNPSPFLVKNGKYRYVSRVAYDGASYRGFQEQEENIKTIQGTISSMLSRRFSRRIKITGASRTDVGVHAQGQVIHFDLEPGLLDDLQHFEFTFNQMLPDDVKIYNVSYAPLGTLEQEMTDDIFHATKSAIGKLYVYRFCTNPFVNPLKRNQYAHFYRPIDIHVLQSCLKLFEGTHDFAAFANRVEKLEKEYAENYENNPYRKEFTTMRTIQSVNLIDEGQGYFRIEFHITSALYKMIRNIVGTSAYVAMGFMEKATMERLLFDAKSRQENLAKTAVPHGLCLEKVFYDNY